MIKRNFFIFILVFFLTIGISITLQSLLAAWKEPNNSPITDSISTPITAGDLEQAKQEGLGLCMQDSPIYDCGDGLLVPNGRVGFGGDPGTNYKLEIKNGFTIAQGGLVIPTRTLNGTEAGSLWTE